MTGTRATSISARFWFSSGELTPGLGSSAVSEPTAKRRASIGSMRLAACCTAILVSSGRRLYPTRR